MNRNGLIKHVNDWISRLGSQNRVAEKCGISSTSLSQWLNGKYGAETTEMDRKISASLGYRENSWNIVTTINNYRRIEHVFNSCKNESMWMAVSNKAGSGKTQTLEHLFNADLTGSVVFVQAEEWSSRQFLSKLAEKTCGIPRKGYNTVSSLLDSISSYFNQMAIEKPLLIIDEADKLKPAALRLLIPLYNRTEHRLGCVLAGTENLHKEIAAGVRISKKGYDEIDSRLGRTYIDLPGASEADVLDICKANGIGDYTAQDIWNEIEKAKKAVKVRKKSGEEVEKMIFFCEDLRRLMRLIKREQMANQLA